eukprot:3023130-Pyramimonas_sp.AAC.1
MGVLVLVSAFRQCRGRKAGTITKTSLEKLGDEACEGCAEMGGEPHVNPATEAFAAAPYGATKR